MSNDTAKEALARWICAQIPRFNFSELKTIAVRVERLGRAKAQYGDDFDLATDPRNMRLEAAYEGVDEKWYQDAQLVFDHDPAFADIRAMRKRERIDAFGRDVAPHHCLRPVAGERRVDTGLASGGAGRWCGQL